MPSVKWKVLMTVMLLLCMPGVHLLAQRPSPPRVFRPEEVTHTEMPLQLLEVNDGLSQGYVHDIVQDKMGYLWISTLDGLNRYDGYTFKVFRHDPKDPLTVSGNFTQPVVDAQGMLMLTAKDGTEDLYDPHTETFRHFPSGANYGIGSLSNGFSIRLLPDGKIIKATGDTQWDLLIPPTSGDLHDVRAYQVLPLEAYFPSLQSLANPKLLLTKLFVSPDGTIWLHRADSLFRFSAEMQAKAQRPAAYSSPMRVNHIASIGHTCGDKPFFSAQGDAFCFAGDTLLKFDEKADSFLPFLVLPKPYGCIGSQLFDHAGRLWIMDHNAGLLRINLEEMSAEAIGMRSDEPGNLAGAAMLLTFEDNSHNIWLRTTGYGLLKIPSSGQLFRSLPQSTPHYDRSLFIHRINTAGKKAVYDAALTARWLEISPKLKFPEPDMRVAIFLLPLVVDAQGYFWVGGFIDKHDGTGKFVMILRVNPNTGTVEIKQRAHSESGYTSQPFLYLDSQQRIWTVAYSKALGGAMALQSLDVNTGEIKRHAMAEKSTDFPDLLTTDWYESPQGKIWMVSFNGLHCIDPSTGAVSAWHHVPGDSHSLARDYLHCVEGDPRAPDRFIWIGTNGGGLDCLDLLTGKFQHFTTADGLPNDVVYAVQFDANHNLWLSTNKGITFLNPRTREIRNFTKDDGLLGSEFNHFEFCKAANGDLYFGGMGGINYFNPEDFYRKGAPSLLLINSLKLDNKPVEFDHSPAPEGSSFRLTAPMHEMRELVFDHNHPMITLGFALMDLTSPSRNQFRYRLIGYNDEWIEAGTSHEAHYTNLSPGHYTFEVMGLNSQNAWTQQPTRLAIVIRPPWWGTWWFRIVVVLLVAALLYAIYRYRVRQLLQMERLRNRIGQDLHDEIGSTLSSISLYGAVMQKTSDSLPPQTMGILDKIIASTTQMMESMNDMVWTIKASNDRFDNVVNRMRAFAVTMTEVQDIQLSFEVDPQVEKLSLGMVERKNVYLIFKEAVNNSVKYSGCKTLQIRIEWHHKRLVLTVQDDGIGFDPAEATGKKGQMGGNGLLGMKARSQEISGELEIVSRPGEGCLVQLSVPV